MAYKPKILTSAEGGTGASNTATSGKVLIGDGTNFVTSTPTFPNAATSTGTILRADGTNWVATTSTYPSTNAVSTLLYASATNVMSALTTANNGLLVTSNTGVPSVLSGPGTTGKVLQSNAAAAPSFSTATYPSTATGTGTILRADGTNWVASTATYPNTAGTSGNVLTSDGTNWASTAPAAAGLGYAFNLWTSSGANPSDASTYFLANALALNIRTTSTANAQTFSIPRAGTITASVGIFFVTGTLGTAENCTLAIRLNNSTDTSISSTIQLTAATVAFSNTALSIAVVAGDYVELKLTTPTWVTNPTAVAASVTVYIS